MQGRITSIAFLLAVFVTGLAWFTFQPILASLLEAWRVWGLGELPGHVRLLPLFLLFDLAAAFGLVYLVLHLTVVRPAARLAATVTQASELAPGEELQLERSAEPLFGKVHSALSRTVRALKDEQERTAERLRELERAHRELERAHAELGRAQTELVASERLATVGRLAAGVAHEVGNPLSGILGYLSLLRAQVLRLHPDGAQSAEAQPDDAKSADAQSLEMVEAIEHEVHRIDAIVRNLLDLGRGAPATHSETTTATELGPLLERTLRLLTKDPELKDVELTTSLPPGVHAYAEPSGIGQILINLVLNAAQAMGGSGRLEVSCRRDGEHCWVEVLDRGPGLSEEALGRVFEPFFTTREVGKGTGLGLAISSQLAQRMGGRLTLENREGGGARAVLALRAVANG